MLVARGSACASDATMPPFNCQILIEGIKERVEALVSHGEPAQFRQTRHFLTLESSGDRLFLGTALGNLLVYSLDKTTGSYIVINSMEGSKFDSVRWSSPRNIGGNKDWISTTSYRTTGIHQGYTHSCDSIR